MRQGKAILDRAFEERAPRTPVFFIKYGPPASGKASIHHAARAERKGPDRQERQNLYWRYRAEADVIADQIRVGPRAEKLFFSEACLSISSMFW